MSDSIEISYFSAGVLAHLVSDGVERWTLERIPRDAVLRELEIAILNWRQADREMVAYRSFRPFLPLLRCYTTYQAQLWALWAIQHVLTAHGWYYLYIKFQNSIHQYSGQSGLLYSPNFRSFTYMCSLST